ncbi:helix-turn-helix domain-containing protein [Granulicella tundricola]|uniref:Helix-turn-helix domain-containing protein n=1 Tax=Granulicella tundricola (strain ATCC BAA-1859 / DSM 23138 / MP5ACTX9) TaxID=1198114 RepID=E8X2P0_GRATM|nr:helix-turn-helix domain-containing protein [Granulicella tundricola]ADW70337.1 hypothetical protein AciX9_3328 [Granulicella tundricola MP5ACTX9]
MRRLERHHSVKQAAELTGLTARTLYNKRWKGELKGEKIGRKLVFAESELRKLFASHHPTKSPADVAA